MEGVTILQEIHETNYALVFCIIFGVTSLLLLLIGFAFRESDMLGSVLPAIIPCVIVSVFLLIYSLANGTETVSYLVVVDDSVSLNEFNKVYEIIGYKGSMLEVVLK